MSRARSIIRIAPPVLLAFSLLGSGLAQAHGEASTDLDEFQQHLDEYQQEVNQLSSLLDGIVDDYAADTDAAAGVDAFVEEWEEVGYHLVVETKATPLYPAIWQGIVGLRDAISNEAPESDVRAAADDLEVALWEGMGGVRLAAANPDLVSGGGEEQAAETPHDTIHHIEDDLDHAVEDYADGELAEAKDLIMKTYLNRFEGLEGDLIEQDPKLVVGLEEDFNARLPMLMDDGAQVEEVQAKVDAMKKQLERAEQLLMEKDKAKSEVF